MATSKSSKRAATGKAQLVRDRLTSLISSMADGVLAVDRFTNIVVYNGAALNILDLNTSVQGAPLDKVMEVIDANNQPVDIIAYVRSITIPTVNESFRLRYPDGSTINLYISISPVIQGFGGRRQNGYVLVLRDITRAKSLEEERNEFVSVVSHELRTPIAIAEGNISNAMFVAGKTGDLGLIKQALRESHEQILFLSSMINDLSTLSRAESGTLTTDIGQVNIHELVGSLAEAYAPDARKKHLALYHTIDPQLELLATCELYVREILQNFITNALKYTEKGSVAISAEPASRGHSSGVLFSVADTGIGISRSDQERIFDKFFRSEDFRTRSTSGTGLGLYVTMKLARLLHAEIDVESKIDRGSTFHVFVPNLR